MLLFDKSFAISYDKFSVKIGLCNCKKPYCYDAYCPLEVVVKLLLTNEPGIIHLRNTLFVKIDEEIRLL